MSSENLSGKKVDLLFKRLKSVGREGIFQSNNSIFFISVTRPVKESYREFFWLVGWLVGFIVSQSLG